MGVSGDLSYSYQVVRKSFPEGIGPGYTSKKKAMQKARLADKIGFTRLYNQYDKKYRFQQHFGYLRPKMAKPYAPYAYGEQAERVRKMFGIKKRE